MSEPQHPYGTDTNAGRPAPDEIPPASHAAPDPVAAVGARLAQLRESKGWTIEDVSARLKVAVPKLRALEAGDLSHLPDTTFALGVVRSYAKMLGADPAPFADALRRERGVSQPDLSMPASAGTDLPRGKVSLSLGGSGVPRRRSWLWGVAAVIVAVIALAMWHTNGGESAAWLARLKAAASGEAGATHANVAEGATTGGASAPQGDEPANGDANQANEADEAGQTDAGAANPQVAPAPVAAAQEAPADAQQSQTLQQAPAPAAATPSQTAANATTNAATAPAAAIPASPAVVASAAGTATFGIEVTQDTWVSVRQKDGKEVFSGLLHGNDARQIAGVAPLRITVGNKAGVASMTLDGQPVDAAKYASAKGNVARFVLP